MAAANSAIMEQAVMAVAQRLEAQLDDQLSALDNCMQNDDDLERLRHKRLAELKQRREKASEWASRGHGEVQDVHDERDFFKAIKGEERAVCHFYRHGSMPCKVMDKHLTLLARRHMPTKFLRVDAERAPFLVERLRVWMLPTVALIRAEKVVDYVVGFDDLGGKDDFTTDVLEERMARSGALDLDLAGVGGGGGAGGAAAAGGGCGGGNGGRSVRAGFGTVAGGAGAGAPPRGRRDPDDEDSDFD